MTRSGRFAFVVANYAPHVGGVETHVREVCLRLRDRGHVVTVFVADNGGERRLDGLEIIGLGRHLERGGAWSLPHPWVAATLRQQFRARRITAVSAHTRFFPTTWVAIHAARRSRAISLLTEHGGGPVASASTVTNMAARLVDRSLGRRCLRDADRVFAVSSRAANLVARVSGRSAFVCGNGVDVAAWRQSRTPVTLPTVAFVGRLVEEKGWRTFINVVASLPQNVNARIAGGGPDAERLLDLVDRLGLRARIEILGQVDAPTLRNTLAGTVYVNPSTAAEGFQTTLLEAALGGARVVTYDVGGAHEIASSGAACWVVDGGDTQSLHEAVRQALDATWQAAPALVRYDWDVITDYYEDALLRAVP